MLCAEQYAAPSRFSTVTDIPSLRNMLLISVMASTVPTPKTIREASFKPLFLSLIPLLFMRFLVLDMLNNVFMH